MVLPHHARAVGDWTTALFGLNDVRAQPWRSVLTRAGAGAAEFGIGLFFFGLLIFSSQMLITCIYSAQLYTWRGTGLMTSIAGVFAFVGLFAPWRLWIRTLAAQPAVAAGAALSTARGWMGCRGSTGWLHSMIG